MVEVDTVIWCVFCILLTVDAAVRNLSRACANMTWICNRRTSRSGSILHRVGFVIPVIEPISCGVVAVESSCHFSVVGPYSN